MKTYRRLFRYIRPYRSRLIVSIICGTLVSGTSALAALLVKPVLDGIFVQRDTTQLLVFPFVILVVYVLTFSR